MELTILTPTYNRAELLKNLFQSLQTQIIHKFEWLIVDDGSTDNTRAMVEEFIKIAKFPIRYRYKSNGGKHTALNIGINEIDSVLTFIVDSDDILINDAVSTILNIHREYANDKGLCGYSFLRLYPDGRINGKCFLKDNWIVSLIESRINNDDVNSDKAEVYFTQILKEYPFPEYHGEKFLGEDIIWIRIAKKYKMVHINKAIYLGSYLESGLTSNRRILNIKSPVGCMNRAKEYMSPEIKFKYRFKGSVQYIIYGKFAGYSLWRLICNSQNFILVALASLPGFLIYKIWNKKFVSKDTK